ncbi:response regulator [Opitutus terrae]|uniref:Response regulator receiver protein n=1 Tax=Opitutus terrae (strain DSM 11246 / JCM 15787 / PB90-1) TaxID=452637 RepID=B1ZUN3_OPITP|nr:response regulator [Opitutus terrae]ACB74917.1 response regulator receiver protein [Opitutus terrae PB90-1]
MTRILFIEESDLFREAMEFCLPRFGHSVFAVAGEREARAVADTEVIEVILMDLDLPIGGGLALCASLHQDAQLGRIPIIVLTELVTPEVSRRALEAGAAGLVAKPFEWDLLLDLITRVTRRATPPLPALFPIACRPVSPPSCVARENSDR